MQFWTFLHIFCMFIAVAAALGTEVFVASAVRRRDLAALRAYERNAAWVDPVGLLFLVAGIAFGLIAAAWGNLDLFQGWLLSAYVLVVIGVIAGVASLPYANRLRAAVRDNEGDEPGEALVTVMASPQPYVWTAVSIVVFGAIIWVMVFKPTF